MKHFLRFQDDYLARFEKSQIYLMCMYCFRMTMV